MNFLDLVFLKKCLGCGRLGSYICTGCFSQIKLVEYPICPVCQRQADGGKTHPGCLTKYSLDGLIAAARFEGVVRRGILKVKYSWLYDISRVFVELMVQNLWRFNFVPEATMIPIPLYPSRKKWRGFNQSGILVQELSKKINRPNLDLLEKSIETKTQVGLSRKERKENLKGVFRIKENINREAIKGKDFILVDDVFTSGATASEAAWVLKRAGAKSVWAMTIALG